MGKPVKKHIYKMRQQRQWIKYKYLLRLLIIVAIIMILVFQMMIKKDLMVFQGNKMIPEKKIDQSFDGFNGTHLWSLRVADDKYMSIAQRVPCRVVEYWRKNESALMNSCIYSSEDEYSLENSVFAQKWLYEHQNPKNCLGKQYAIINRYALYGYGSTIHQIAWALGIAIAENRIAIYGTPGNWMYTDCDLLTLDCVFLPISNCSIPSTLYIRQTRIISADLDFWSKPVHPPVFKNYSFNWYRSQLVFYLMRLKPDTLSYIQNMIHRSLNIGSLDVYRPYIAMYVRRSDKVTSGEMLRAHNLSEYMELFHADAQRAHITNLYFNSEDVSVFAEFNKLDLEIRNYYRLFSMNFTRNATVEHFQAWSKKQRALISMEFLTDLYIQFNADLHVGTLSSNWCRLVDEIRLVLGKKIPFYTPEKKYMMDYL